MNTPNPYKHRNDRNLNEAPHQPDVTGADQTAPDHIIGEADGHPSLALHRDPSQPTSGATTPATARSKPSVAWVRPTDMPTMIGAPWVRRGIDLQTELTRRARRSPITATTRARGRISRTAITRPEPATPTTRKELEL